MRFVINTNTLLLRRLSAFVASRPFLNILNFGPSEMTFVLDSLPGRKRFVPRRRIAFHHVIFVLAAVYGLVSFWLNISVLEKLIPFAFEVNHDSPESMPGGMEHSLTEIGKPRSRIKKSAKMLNYSGSTHDPKLTRFHTEGPCVDGWRSKNCYTHIVQLAEARQVNGTVIVVVAARGSFEVILNWCLSVKRLGIANYFLVALDHEAFSFLSERGAPVVQLPRETSGKYLTKSDIWVKRTFVTYMILKAGINVLVSDADAVMMKSPVDNPLSFYNDKTFDIISSPSNFPNPKRGELPAGCPTPPPGASEWRHQPCMGWMLLRSKKRMLNFFTELLLPHVIKYKDDQIGFSCAIRKTGAVWNETEVWTSNSTMRIKSKTPRLKLVMLPAAQYVRNCTQSASDKERGYGIYKFDVNVVQMYHCKGHNKRKNAENNNFWFLSDNWKAVQPFQAESYNSYLASIRNRSRSLIS